MTRSFSNQTAIKTIVIFCFLFLSGWSFAQTEILEQQIKVPDYSGSAKILLDKIGKAEKIVFAYSSEVSLSYQVKFNKREMLLKEFLENLTTGRNIYYEVKGKKILLFPKKGHSSQPVGLTQTVRGTIIDTDSKSTLIGATVIIANTNPIIGTITDVDGNFRLEDIPVGRITLQLSYIGYENITIPNIVVNSGKEVILHLNMQESAVKLNEVVIKASNKKGEALNNMSLISARSISGEETKRYAGGFDDPSRVVSSFAGVANSTDGSSDIIVRGNSPKYMQWRLEGVEISNPYHFGDPIGGISSLNNNLLTASDFYTGAFSPEYGDVLSSVYDAKLRTGNNEKFESTFAFGLMGTDLTLEGPIKKGYAGSFLVNYRYSTASLISELGLVDVGGVPKYQDATFKIVLPTKNAGIFSFFGLGGLSSYYVEDIQPDIRPTPGNKTRSADIIEDFDKATHLLNIGMNHSLIINNNSFIKTSLSYSSNGVTDEVFESNIIKIYDGEGEFLEDSIVNRKLNFDNRLMESTYRGAITYSNKINAKNKIQIGVKYTLFDYDYKQSQLQHNETDLFTLIDFKENVSTLRNFISWKHRLNEKITIVSGFHNMNILLNNKSTLEPRVAFNWKLSNRSSIHVGYGNHSNMEKIHNYFAKVEQDDGTVTEPNKDLGLLKAHHFVLGYEKRFSKNLMVKVEAYYQDLYSLPVENNDTSFYATINEGFDYKYVDLINRGTGKNYGVEFTIERFFDDSYYFLINGSIFNSKYTSLEGVERNTQYNGNYLFNILCGKEFENLGKKKNQILAINIKSFFGGGKRYIPLLRNGQGEIAVDPEKNRYWDYENAYNNKIDDIYQINLSMSYKFNRPKATHEIFIDLQNITDNRSKLYEYYDENEPNSIGYITQLGCFPILMYRVYF